MLKRISLQVLLLASALAAQAQYVFKAVDLGGSSDVSDDGQGGLCYISGAQILHTDLSGAAPQLLISESELLGWSIHDESGNAQFACFGSDIYLVASKAAQQKGLPPDSRLVRKHKGGAVEELMKTGQKLTFTLAGTRLDATPTYPYQQVSTNPPTFTYTKGFTPLTLISSAGRTFVIVLLTYNSGPNVGARQFAIIDPQTDGSLIGRADMTFVGQNGTFFNGCETTKFYWTLSKQSQNALWQPWRFDLSAKGEMLTTSPLDGRVMWCSSSGAALGFVNPNGFNLRFWPDSGSAVEMLTNVTNLGGKAISDFDDISVAEAGDVYLTITNPQNDNYVFRVSQTAQELVKGPQDSPAGQPQQTFQSGPSTFLVNLNGSVTAYYRVLRPHLTGTLPLVLTGRVGDAVIIPCVDCSDGIVSIGGKTIPSAVVATGLSFVIPAGLSGAVSGQVQVSSVNLPFMLSIQPNIVPATVSAITAITGETKNTFAQGELVTIWGSNLALAPLPNSGLPLPTQLGCRVLVDMQSSPLYYCSSGQVNAVLPQAATPGMHTLTVQRLATDGSTETTSNAGQIMVAATSPTLLGNDRIPVFLQNITQDPNGNTFVTASTPAHPGDVLIVYATGLGATDPPLADGVAAVANVIAGIQLQIGGRAVSLLGAVASPQFPGLYQIAFAIPVDAVSDKTGIVQAQLVVNGKQILFGINLVVDR